MIAVPSLNCFFPLKQKAKPQVLNNGTGLHLRCNLEQLLILAAREYCGLCEKGRFWPLVGCPAVFTQLELLPVRRHRSWVLRRQCSALYCDITHNQILYEGSQVYKAICSQVSAETISSLWSPHYTFRTVLFPCFLLLLRTHCFLVSPPL